MEKRERITNSITVPTAKKKRKSNTFEANEANDLDWPANELEGTQLHLPVHNNKRSPKTSSSKLNSKANNAMAVDSCQCTGQKGLAYASIDSTCFEAIAIITTSPAYAKHLLPAHSMTIGSSFITTLDMPERHFEFCGNPRVTILRLLMLPSHSAIR